MFLPTHSVTADFSLLAMVIWGTSDFLGGIGAKRANAFLFTTAVNLSGCLLMCLLAMATGASFPARATVLWALLAGSIGGIALALFYRALASGKMGLTAPVAAVLGAGIPTLVTAFTAGFPGYRHAFGFVLAGVGVWLISRTEDGAGRPEGVGLAVLSGIGFAGFYLCIQKAGQGSALWIAGASRFASLLVTSACMLAGKQLRVLPRAVLSYAAIAGCLDATGSFLFVRAEQSGRLDMAVVLSSLYPAITVLLARIFLREHFSRNRTIGMVAALAAIPMIVG